MTSEFPPMENTAVFMGSGSELKSSRGVIMGAPLDDTVSFRPGSRFAPQAVRTVSRALEEYSINLGKDLRDISFFDAGDLALSYGDTQASLEAISRSATSFLKMGKKLFIMGGEHTVTLGAVRGCLEIYKELTVLCMDAHADLRPSYQGVSNSHASVAYFLKNLPGVQLFQLGVRSADREEMPYLQGETVSLFSVVEPLKILLPRLKGLPLYITLDIDVVDPAFAPGVGTPEPGGISSGEILEIFPLLKDFKEQVIAFDLVEICPPHDHSQVTALLGAKIMREALLSFL